MGYSNPYFIKKKLPSWGSQNIRGYGDSNLDPDGNPMYGDEPQMDWAGMGQDAAAGFSAGIANSQPISDFTIDPYAGFKGSGQGFASAGPIGAIIGGVTAQVGQFSKINKNLRDLDTGVQGVTYDAYGRPVYSGQNIIQANANIGELDKGINKLNKTHLDPATNLISSFTGTRTRMKRKRGELQQGIQQAQSDFNQSDMAYRDQMNQMTDYRQRLNPRRRYQNLYRQY